MKLELDKLPEQDKAKKVESVLKDNVKKLAYLKNDAIVKKYVDRIQLGKQGYKFRYYSEKFHVHTKEDHEEF